MSKAHASTDEHDELGFYTIRLKGHLDGRWANWFEGLAITLEDNGETLLTGPVTDQAALHGLLRKVRDLGLPLLSVNRIEPSQNETCQRHSKQGD
jgi:hypothetical protein